MTKSLREPVILALCLAVIAATQFVAHGRSDDIDVYLYMYFGEQLAQGRSLYVDVWDFKPPGVYWMSAVGAALGGPWLQPWGTRIGMIAVCAATVAATCGLFFLICRRLFGQVTAGIATVIASIYLFQPLYHAGGLRPGTFIMAAELGAALLYLVAQHATSAAGGGRWTSDTGVGRYKSRPRVLVIAGFLIVVAMCFKQTAVGFGVAAVVHQFWLSLRRGQGVDVLRRSLASMALGGATALALIVAMLWQSSDLSQAWQAIFVFPARYAAAAGNRHWWLTWFEARGHIEALTLPLILAIAVIGYQINRKVKGRKVEGRATLDLGPSDLPISDVLLLLVVWFLVATAAAVISPNRQTHYFAPALPPLMLMAAWGGRLIADCGLRIADSPTRVPHPSRACARGDRNDVLARGGGRTESPIRNPQSAIRNPQSPHFPTWVAGVWLAYMLLTPLENQFERTATTYYDVFVAPPDRREAMLVGAIHRHCEPGERLYITGYRPRLWYLACRPPAVRHCGAMSAARLGEAGLPILKEIVAGLKRNPPKAIVTAGDELSRLFAAVDRGEQGSSLLYLTRYYELAPEISGERLWIRRD